MLFFSGFSLHNEQYLFSEFIKEGAYTISGFSYGSIKALNTTLEALDRGERVDTLQLFSPVFFQTKPEKFKRLQLMSYRKNKDFYMKGFLKGCFAPYEMKIVENIETEKEELQELLEYTWSLETLNKVVNRGVDIEVYLGGEDKIIDALGAKKFFLQIATVTYIKKANHFLQLN